MRHQTTSYLLTSIPSQPVLLKSFLYILMTIYSLPVTLICLTLHAQSPGQQFRAEA
ncbi:unnamed protein product [Leptidea sinapis]|uniref:Uncharacterized protein n=1 Tax=Leptidea sinapis TaxID=189913 RepID=A0A5E4Q7Z9_9NEOP|nr:unnamed protein product [Leptidea sinapis]